MSIDWNDPQWVSSQYKPSPFSGDSDDDALGPAKKPSESLGGCLLSNDPKGIGQGMIAARKQGISWSDIAKQFDLPNPSAARKAFTKYTGITDYKVKGDALETLVKQMAEGTVETGTVAAKQAVKSVDDALAAKPDKVVFSSHETSLNTQPTMVAETTKPKWLSNTEVAEQVGVSIGGVGDIIAMVEDGKGYTAIKQALSVNGENVDFAQIDKVAWNSLLKKHEGKTWKAYAEKPTSESGMNAVKEKVWDLHAKGLDAKQIAKVQEAPPEGVIHAILDDTWVAPPMGATKPIIPAIPPPPPPQFTGVLKGGTNYRRHSDGEMLDWVQGLGMDLSPDEYGAVRDYTGSGYHKINDALRDKAKGVPARTPRNVKHLDKAMRPIPFDTIVTRNISGLNAFGGVPPDKLIGTVFRDPAFLSTSIKEGGVFSGNVQMIIKVPKGTQSRYVNDISYHKSEKELILGRETRMVIHSVEETTGNYGEKKWRVFMEVIHG